MLDFFKEKNSSERKELSLEERNALLMSIASYWYKGEHQFALECCKKYGFSSKEFAQAQLVYSRKQPSSIDSQEKLAALRLALKYWNEGQYQKAMDLCVKYGISNRDFSCALVASMKK